MAAAASSSAGREALTRLSMPIKDAALEAAKRAKPQWHLIDAKDQVRVVVLWAGRRGPVALASVDSIGSLSLSPP